MVLNLPSLDWIRTAGGGLEPAAIRHQAARHATPSLGNAPAPQSQPVTPAPRLAALSRRRWLSGLGRGCQPQGQLTSRRYSYRTRLCQRPHELNKAGSCVERPRRGARRQRAGDLSDVDRDTRRVSVEPRPSNSSSGAARAAHRRETRTAGSPPLRIGLALSLGSPTAADALADAPASSSNVGWGGRGARRGLLRP